MPAMEHLPSFKMSYLQIAERMKKACNPERGFTFSVGLAPNG